MNRILPSAGSAASLSRLRGRVGVVAWRHPHGGADAVSIVFPLPSSALFFPLPSPPPQAGEGIGVRAAAMVRSFDKVLA